MRSEFIDSENVTERTYDWRRDGWLAACAVAAALLVISAATPPAPGYDKFLRIFIFCVALIRAFAAFRRGGAWLPLSAALIAILFNPAAPLAMSRTAWIWCDLIAAAWFAIAGAWQLLRDWQPQRGWAAALVSLAALAVPAVAAMSMPNRDALNPAELDENLAVMNAAANSSAAPAESNATAAAPTGIASASAADSAKRGAATAAAEPPRPAARSVAHASGAESADHVTTAKAEPAPLKVVQAPPFPGNDAASSDGGSPATAPVNNESAGNQEVQG